MRVRSSVLIARPIADVFAYVADFRNDPQWRSEVRDMRYLSDGPVGVGTRLRETSALLGRLVVTESVIPVFEMNARVDFDSVSGPFRVRGSRTFAAVVDGTRLTYELEWQPVGMYRLVAPMVAGMYQRTVDRYLARVAAILEATPRSGTDVAAEVIP
jgi:uncharacterized membrane protein